MGKTRAKPKRCLIYIDLDCTLLDSHKRIEEEITIAAKYGISEEEFLKAVRLVYQRYGTTNFTYQALWEVLTESHPGLSPQLKVRLEQLLRKKYFFPDTLDFLRGFYPQELCIVSEGRIAFQEIKINTHGLRQYVERVIIVEQGGKADVIPNSKQLRTFFLDDAPRVIEKVKKAHPEIFCILVRQAAPWEEQKTTELADAHCPDLHRARDLIHAILRYISPKMWRKIIEASRQIL